MMQSPELSRIRQGLTDRLQNLQTPEGGLSSALKQVGQNVMSTVDNRINPGDVETANLEEQISAADLLHKAAQMGNQDAKDLMEGVDFFLGKDAPPSEKAQLYQWLHDNDTELTPENKLTMIVRGKQVLGLKGASMKPQSELGQRYADQKAGLIPEGIDLNPSDGGGRPPSGYMWTPQGTLQSIPGGPGDNTTFQQEEKLRDDFNTQTKDFRTVQDAYNKINSASDSAQGDFSLIYQFNKLLDPGSVVRETEFANVANSGSLGQRIQNAMSRISSGERLTPEQRQAFKDEAKRVHAGQKQGYDKSKNYFRNVAKGYNLNPDRIVMDYDNIEPVTMDQLNAPTEKMGNVPPPPPGFEVH